MKKALILTFLPALFIFILASCQNGGVQNPTSPVISVDNNPGGGGTTNEIPEEDWNLIAGQNIPVGVVTVTKDIDSLTVTYITYNDWTMSEIHFDVQLDNTKFPMNKGGNPKTGKFVYNTSVDNLPSYQFRVAYPAEGTAESTLYCAAHAVVSRTVAGVTQTETAWRMGTRFSETKGNWSMYFSL